MKEHGMKENKNEIAKHLIPEINIYTSLKIEFFYTKFFYSSLV